MEKEEMARQLRKAFVELEDCGVAIGDAKDYFHSAQNRVEKLAKEAEKWLQETESSTA